MKRLLFITAIIISIALGTEVFLRDKTIVMVDTKSSITSNNNIIVEEELKDEKEDDISSNSEQIIKNGKDIKVEVSVKEDTILNNEKNNDYKTNKVSDEKKETTNDINLEIFEIDDDSVTEESILKEEELNDVQNKEEVVLIEDNKDKTALIEKNNLKKEKNDKKKIVNNNQKDIVLIDKSNGLCAQAIDYFYEDSEYKYYFRCIKSHSVYVLVNNIEYSLVYALNNKIVTMQELNAAGYHFLKENKNTVTE